MKPLAIYFLRNFTAMPHAAWRPEATTASLAL